MDMEKTKSGLDLYIKLIYDTGINLIDEGLDWKWRRKRKLTM